MIYARHIQVGAIESNPYITWVNCDTDKLMPNGAIQNQIRVSYSFSSDLFYSLGWLTS